MVLHGIAVLDHGPDSDEDADCGLLAVAAPGPGSCGSGGSLLPPQQNRLLLVSSNMMSSSLLGPG